MKVDRAAREIELKVVYYGPGLAGKTTNMQYIYERTHPEQRGKVFWRATGPSYTPSFTFAAATLAPVNGMTLRLHLITTPSNIFHDPARLDVLEDADGVIFVADSQVERSEANQEMLEDLEANLDAHRRSLSGLPFTLQYNKRDLPNVMPVSDLDAQLNRHHHPAFGAVAKTGEGVFDTLKSLARTMLDRFRSDAPPSGTPYRG